MALASWPARQGQQRSLRRICQVLSWAFARSPGARSLAWARLASFWDSGLFLPLYGVFACRAALVALVGQGDQPGGLQLGQDAPDPRGLHVVHRAGQRPRTPTGCPRPGWR